jgi:hypothetical protein
MTDDWFLLGGLTQQYGFSSTHISTRSDGGPWRPFLGTTVSLRLFYFPTMGTVFGG